MTKQEYDNKMADIENQYQKQKKELYVEYAMSHNNVKVGDIIKDTQGFLKVEKIRVYKGFDLPECIYQGKRLTKDGKTERKRDAQDNAYQSRVIND